MERTIRVLTFDEHAKGNADLEYWLTRPPEERVSAVERLRVQHHGTGVRLQRVLRNVIDPRRVIQMGVPPVQIHIMSDISGIGWDDAWAGRESGRLGDLEIAFLGLDGLLTNKRASGRTKDLADVEALTRGDPQDS
jgi:hypothetical protein